MLLRAAFFTLLATAPAWAQQSVSIGGTQGILMQPASPRASAVLVPGAGGVHPADVLVRNQAAFAAQGIGTVAVPHQTNLAAAVQHMRGIVRPVTIVGMSAGTPIAAAGIARGAGADGTVFAGGVLMPGPRGRSVQQALGSPGRLPPTLVVHHREDACVLTAPEAVAPFQQWAGSRVRVQWITGGSEAGPPCGARAKHAFFGADAAFVSAVSGFVLSPR
jgi:hypothetical protein